IIAKGGKAHAVVLDLRDEDQIKNVALETITAFGTIDILVNNASAIYLAGVEHTPSKRYDLMHQINVRGTYLMSQVCIPYLKKSSHAHILTLSPRIDINAKWFENHTAYTMSKYGMSMVMFGLAAELKEYGVAANALWPRTTIATAAVQNLLGGDTMIRQCRKPEIVADAAYHILSQSPAEATGQFYIDEEVLRRYGVTDFDAYAVDPSVELAPDIFVEL
ncbi:MAG: SDR family oxidoreductase, partial [Bacteroidota bacterium]|nr:SDR family oxidoreductase [Bacteroidota bacterium]